MGSLAARPHVQPIVTKCRTRAATAKAAQLGPERAGRFDGATPIRLSGAFAPFARPSRRSASPRLWPAGHHHLVRFRVAGESLDGR
jgi:hypothetical protein